METRLSSILQAVLIAIVLFLLVFRGYDWKPNGNDPLDVSEALYVNDDGIIVVVGENQTRSIK